MIYNILSIMILASSFILMVPVLNLIRQSHKDIKFHIDPYDELRTKTAGGTCKNQNVAINTVIGSLLIGCYFIYGIVFPVNIWGWIIAPIVYYFAALILFLWE